MTVDSATGNLPDSLPGSGAQDCQCLGLGRQAGGKRLHKTQPSSTAAAATVTVTAVRRGHPPAGGIESVRVDYQSRVDRRTLLVTVQSRSESCYSHAFFLASRPLPRATACSNSKGPRPTLSLCSLRCLCTCMLLPGVGAVDGKGIADRSGSKLHSWERSYFRRAYSLWQNF